MGYNPEIHHRRSIRLKNYDYNQGGAYFITICVQNRQSLLGQIGNGIMELNEYGKIVQNVWEYLPTHFSHVSIDAAIIMPNHFHGIIIIDNNRTGGETARYPFGGGETAPLHWAGCTGAVSPPPLRKTKLGRIIAYFKYQSTKLINVQRDQIGVKFWQRNYYEHIIRCDRTLGIIRQYIIDNPRKWEIDQLHPDNPSKW